MVKREAFAESGEGTQPPMGQIVVGEVFGDENGGTGAPPVKG